MEEKTSPESVARKAKRRKGMVMETTVQVDDINWEKKAKKRRKKTQKAKEGEVVQLESDFSQSGASPAIEETKYQVVHVLRPEHIERGRQNLPIVMMEQEIMEAIQENPVVLICGETGCGKTTQVPQFLYEAGFGSLRFSTGGIIGVTQPRRVAVLATARRVAQELSVQLGHEVGFQVRHDRKIGEKSCIKFMTDGILLRELQADFLLRKYSVIVLDEAHERSLNTDILIGMLSRIVPLRQQKYDEQLAAQKNSMLDGNSGSRGIDWVKPLKLVIMSATLRVEDFTANQQMFRNPPPVLRAPSRQFPVTVHFSKKTELLDYVGACYKTVCAIHRKLPPGGILVFLTGQREVEDLCRTLRNCFKRDRKNNDYRGLPGDRDERSECRPKVDDLGQACVDDKCFGGLNLDTIAAAADADGQEDTSDGEKSVFSVSYDDSGGERISGLPEIGDETDEEVVDSATQEETAFEKLRRSLYALSDRSNERNTSTALAAPKKDSGKSNSSSAGNKDIIRSDTTGAPGPIHVLPLYAMLPAAAQLRVFSDVPEGTRLVVVATNVAETSITIPGVRYVVDCGRAKEKEVDQSSGICKYEVRWISKASADQRAGRAGRTGPGHCYRLYSSALFNNNFPQFALPEISTSSIEGVVLLMKNMGILKVANFPFPTPPDHVALVEAEKCLMSLAALNRETSLLTPLGQAMASYPISPRHSRMLLAAIQGAQNLALETRKADAGLALAYAVAVAAVLSLEDPFLREAPTLQDGGVPVKNGGLAVDNPALGRANANPNDHSRSGHEADPTPHEAQKVRKKLKNKASAAHAKFKNVTSDAISIASALREYDQAEDPEGFCRFHLLHAKTMHEMSKLRKQLWALVRKKGAYGKDQKQVLTDDPSVTLSRNDNFWSLCEDCWRTPLEKTKLNSMQEDLVRQAICAGWADKVARRLSGKERASLSELWVHREHTLYRSCSSKRPVYLHPSSSVSEVAPEYVVYNELVSSSHTYMRGVTHVDSEWLAKQAGALCTFSKPSLDRPPWYDSVADEVKCWVYPSFGPYLWKLRRYSAPMKEGTHRCAVFAAALLRGKVLPSMGVLQKYLANDPNLLLRPESQVLKRVSDIMYRLGNKRSEHTNEWVDTRCKLRNAWAADYYFLHDEIVAWVQTKFRTRVEEIWDSLVQESQLSGEELYSKRNIKGS